MTKEELAKMIKDEHNVEVDIDYMMYTHGNIDDAYGWNPIPKEWFNGLEINYQIESNQITH